VLPAKIGRIANLFPALGSRHVSIRNMTQRCHQNGLIGK
jgi:hypothetical protein